MFSNLQRVVKTNLLNTKNPVGEEEAPTGLGLILSKEMEGKLRL